MRQSYVEISGMRLHYRKNLECLNPIGSTLFHLFLEMPIIVDYYFRHIFLSFAGLVRVIRYEVEACQAVKFMVLIVDC